MAVSVSWTLLARGPIESKLVRACECYYLLFTRFLGGLGWLLYNRAITDQSGTELKMT